MFIGEIKKLVRNKKFIVVVSIMLLVEIMTIIYCLGEKNAEYVDYRNSLQKEYIETYDIFINGIDERAQTLLSSLGNNNDVYYKRNIDKMVSDYKRLSGVQIDQKYNWGVEKYADYTYGIFFCIVFTFVCMEYIYVSERKSAMLGIIRATKEGRSRIILSKWTVLVVMTVIFSLVQEIMVIVFDSFMYSTGNLKCSIQSLQIFRDCPYEISMFTAIIISILNHMFMAIIICSIVFVCFVSINSRIMECGIPIAIFLLEFLSLNDSPNNIFYAWNMKNVIGVYQNLNIAGTPVDKNYVNFIVGLAIIVFATLIGTILFSIRYVSEIKVVLQYIREKIRNIFSRLLCVENMYVNEFYKLMIVQKKWILLLFLSIGIIGSYKTYMPANTYQSAYEATYHMYLSAIHGKIDEQTVDYIEKEKQYIQSVENQIELAIENNGIDTAEITAELDSRKRAFDRLNQQYEKMTDDSSVGYMIDEMNLNSVMKNYRSDIIIFMTVSIVLVMFISGLFASKDEMQVSLLLKTSKNGRYRLMRVKKSCAIIIGGIIYLTGLIPSIAGYMHVLGIEELKVNVNKLYEPQISAGISLLVFLTLIYLIKALYFGLIGAITIALSKKTGNEFVVSIFVTLFVIVIALILYFSKINLTMILIKLANRGII